VKNKNNAGPPTMPANSRYLATMRRVLISAALASAALVPFGAAHPQDDKWDFAAPHKQHCSLGTMLDMNRCLADEYKKVDGRLNDSYRQLIGSLADPSLLRKSQAAWIRFRDLDCEYASSGITADGSLRPFSDNACRIDLTEKRIRDLERYLGWDCNGCPPRK
jgi:uncharacterized protein YecT (DUF1311 family)